MVEFENSGFGQNPIGRAPYDEWKEATNAVSLMFPNNDWVLVDIFRLEDAIFVAMLLRLWFNDPNFEPYDD